MALRRVFVDRIEGESAAVRGPAARHLAGVARLRPGERVEVSDQAKAYRAIAEACSVTEIRFRIEAPVAEPAPLPPLRAALAIIRFPRFEWALEKLTEIGVQVVIPVIAERSDAKLVAAAPKRLDRWTRIAFESAQQARRLAAPAVQPPEAFGPAVRGCPDGARLLADPAGPPVADVYRGGPATFLVGPEGGWTDEEARLASEHGFARARLGPTILRSETAAVSFAAVCSCRLADGGAA